MNECVGQWSPWNVVSLNTEVVIESLSWCSLGLLVPDAHVASHQVEFH